MCICFVILPGLKHNSNTCNIHGATSSFLIISNPETVLSTYRVHLPYLHCLFRLRLHHYPDSGRQVNLGPQVLVVPPASHDMDQLGRHHSSPKIYKMLRVKYIPEVKFCYSLSPYCIEFPKS